MRGHLKRAMNVRGEELNNFFECTFQLKWVKEFLCCITFGLFTIRRASSSTVVASNVKMCEPRTAAVRWSSSSMHLEYKQGCVFS